MIQFVAFKPLSFESVRLSRTIAKDVCSRACVHRYECEDGRHCQL